MTPLADIEGFLARHERKELVRFTTVGSVDDGKSTLIGRLLHDAGAVFDDQLRAVKKASRGRLGDDAEPEEIDFSLFTDGLLAEREQGITIDVAYRYFSTEKRKFIIADTPGHEQYTRNMATGASTADIAIILLDARLGVLPQSRRHAAIASLLGISQLVVAVNKMDLVAYDETVFERLKEEFRAFTNKLSFGGVSFVPVSARRGDNVVTRGRGCPWYKGPTLLELLDSVPITRAKEDEPFRFPVQAVLRPNLDYRGFAGMLARGVVRAGEEIVVLPSGRRSRVQGIDMFEGSLTHATAPLSVTLRLEDEVDISRGEMIAPASEPPIVSCDLEARVVWFSDRPFDPARKILLKHTSRWTPVRIASIGGHLSLESLGLDAASSIQMNDIAQVRLRTTKPIFCDPYRVCRATGAFILVDALTNATIAAGMIESAQPLSGVRGADEPVTSGERAERLGHRAAVVRVATRDVAARIERALFDQGVQSATTVEPLAVAALHAAGLVVLVPDLNDTDFQTLVRSLEVPQSLDARSIEGDVALHLARAVSLMAVEPGRPSFQGSFQERPPQT